MPRSNTRSVTPNDPNAPVTGRQIWFLMILLSVGDDGFGAFVPGWDDDDLEEDTKPSQHAADLLTQAGFNRGSIAEMITALNDAKKAAKGKGPKSKATKALAALRAETIQATMAIVTEAQEAREAAEAEAEAEAEAAQPTVEPEASEQVSWKDIMSEEEASLAMDEVAFFISNLNGEERAQLLARILVAKGM